MLVFAYRVENEEKVKITHVFNNDTKLRWADDNSLSIFHVPYNHMKLMKNDDELKDDIIS